MKKLLRYLVFLSVFFLGVATGESQAAMTHEAPLEKRSMMEVLEELGDKYDVLISYESSIMKDIEVEFEILPKEDLESAFKRLLQNSDFLYELLDDKYVLVYQEEQKHRNTSRKIMKSIPKLDGPKTGMKLGVLPRIFDQRKQPLRKLASLAPLTDFDQVVKGKVIDEDGEPLIGVNIQVKGSTKGTATDFDGEFVLEDVKAEDVLIVSYVGYTTQEVEIGGSFNIEIVMRSDSQLLDEVVVIAYGEQKRSAFTGSAAVVSSDVIDRRPVSNVMDVLEGMSPGVQVQSSSGAPNASPSFRIRGASSINAGRSPLIVVDGVPYEAGWNNINPNDVESVTVLKDAASTAIYGARGGNGVVLITTKKAKRDEELSVSFGSKFAVSQVRTNDLYDVIDEPGEFYEQHYKALYNYYQNVMGMNSFEANQAANDSWLKNSDEGGLGYLVYTVPEGENLIGTNGKVNPNAVLGRVATGTDGKQYLQTPDDWVKETYKTGFRQDYNLNINGGGEKLSLMASGGYTNDEGITDAAFFERYTGRLKGVLDARSWLRVSANLDVAVSDYKNNTDYSNNSNNIFSNANRVAPIYPIFIRNPDGSIALDENGDVYDYGDGKHNDGISRPINTGSSRHQEALIQSRDYESMKMGSQVAADFILTPNLTATLNVGYDQRDRRYTSTRQPFYGSSNPGGTTSISATKKTSLNLQQLINYNKNFGFHNVMVTLLHESFNTDSYSLSGGRSNLFNYFGNQELAGAITMTSNNSYSNNYQSEGYGGRILYDFKNKYNFDASFRRDASSRFHPDHWWGNFFSFGGAYVISQEDFFRIPWIDDLKFKLSFGQNGNDQIGNHRYTDTYTIENLDGEIAVTFLNRGNESITWETRTAINTGVEFELFKGRLNGGVDYYYNKTTNMLASVSVPYSLGYSSYYDNVGSMRNSGVELDLRAGIVRRGDFQWNVYFNASYNDSKVLELAEERKGETLYDGEGNPVAEGYSSGRFFYGEGLEFRTWYLKKFAGVDEEGRPTWYMRDEEAEGGVTTTTTYSSASYFESGSSQPKLIGGFGGNFSWKAFQLFYSFAYRLGGYGYDSGYATLMNTPYNGHTGYNFHKDVLESWTPENPSEDFARWEYDLRYFASSSDRWLTKADYLNLQNVSLGYKVPNHFFNHIGIRELVVSAGVDNIFYLSHRKGFVPSRNFDGNVDFGYFPAISRLMFNLNFKF